MLSADPLAGQRTQGGRVATFIETFTTLGGSYLGQPFRLLPFQRDVLDDIYRVDAAGRRLRRTYLLGLPRKSGKSQLGAAVALYHLIADRSDSAPLVISAAGDRAQARLVFGEAARMVRGHPDLAAACRVYRDVIECSLSGGTYRVVSADHGLAQGYGPSMVVFDEYHVFGDDRLYTALQMGSGARRQPLTLVISTAGHDLDGPLGRLYSYGLTVKGHRRNGGPHDGEVDDHAFGMTWWGPEPGESVDPDDADTWQRFNPAWDILNHEEMAAARRVTHESQFIRYRLNGWTSTAESWLPHGAWDKLTDKGRPFRPVDELVVGFDGAWKGDSTALVGVRLADMHMQVLGCWEAPVGDPHWRVPAADVLARIREVCDVYTVRELCADPYRWEETLRSVAESGVAPVVEFPTNSIARMVPATQQLYDAVMDGTVTHDGDARLARHIGNAVAKSDARGVRISKEYKSSRAHIDLAVAAVIAHHRARAWRADETPSESALLVL